MVEIDIKIKIDGEDMDSDAIAEWLRVPKQLRKIKALLKLSQDNEEKIMSEIEDLNVKLDSQATAITDFNTTLQSATGAIATEIQQLADAVQSATDLAALKAAVSAAAARVQANNDAIAAAGATLQASVADLAADDPVVP